MEWQHYLPTLVLLLVAAASAALAIYAWRSSTASWARAYAIMMETVTWWELISTIQLTNSDLDSRLVWVNLNESSPSNAIAVEWLVFVLLYTNRQHWVTRRRVLLLLVVPLLSALAAWTNPLHHLHHTDVSLEVAGPFVAMRLTNGPVLWLQLVYSYALVVVGVALLVHSAAHWAQPYRFIAASGA
jgi:hypothetical protein